MFNVYYYYVFFLFNFSVSRNRARLNNKTVDFENGTLAMNQQYKMTMANMMEVEDENGSSSKISSYFLVYSSKKHHQIKQYKELKL